MQEQILKALRDNPRMNIPAVAKLLDVNPIAVSQAQHAYLKPFLKRDSKMWGIPQYGKTAKKTI